MYALGEWCKCHSLQNVCRVGQSPDCDFVSVCCQATRGCKLNVWALFVTSTASNCIIFVNLPLNATIHSTEDPMSAHQPTIPTVSTISNNASPEWRTQASIRYYQQSTLMTAIQIPGTNAATCATSIEVQHRSTLLQCIYSLHPLWTEGAYAVEPAAVNLIVWHIWSTSKRLDNGTKFKWQKENVLSNRSMFCK